MDDEAMKMARRYSNDPDMGHLSDDTIRRGIEIGRQQIAILDGNLALDDAMATDHGAFDRPSKVFEAWSNTDHERRTRALRFAVSEAEKELTRREHIRSGQQFRKDG